MGVPAMTADFHAAAFEVKDRAELVARVERRISEAQPKGGYQSLGFTMLPRELKAAAEAAVDEVLGR
jgi:thioesterase domain-containing protein